MVELASTCLKHQKTIGGFTIIYNYEEGEDSFCPVCKLQAEKTELEERIELSLKELEHILGHKTPTEIRIEQALKGE